MFGRRTVTVTRTEEPWPLGDSWAFALRWTPADAAAESDR